MGIGGREKAGDREGEKEGRERGPRGRGGEREREYGIRKFYSVRP